MEQKLKDTVHKFNFRKNQINSSKVKFAENKNMISNDIHHINYILSLYYLPIHWIN